MYPHQTERLEAALEAFGVDALVATSTADVAARRAPSAAATLRAAARAGPHGSDACSPPSKMRSTRP